MSEKIEKDKRGNEGCYHADADYNGRLGIAQKEQGDDKHKQEAEREIFLEVGNRVVEQFGLVAVNRKFYVGITALKVGDGFAERVFKIFHRFVGLLDDTKRDGALAVNKRKACLGLTHDVNFSQVFELKNTFVLTQINVADIIGRAQQRREFNVVFIITVAHDHAAGLDIVGCQRSFNIVQVDGSGFQLVDIGNNLYMTVHQACHIGHRDFG